MRRDILRTVGLTLAVAYGLFLAAFPLVPSAEDLKPEPPADPAEIQREAERALAALIRTETSRLASVHDWGPQTSIDVPTEDPCADASGIADLMIEQLESATWDDVTVALSMRAPQSSVTWVDVSADEEDKFAVMLDTVCALPPEISAHSSLHHGLVDLYPSDPGAVSPETAEQARTAIFDAGLRPTVWAWEFEDSFRVDIEP